MKEADKPPFAGHRADDLAIGLAVLAAGRAMTGRNDWPQ